MNKVERKSIIVPVNGLCFRTKSEREDTGRRCIAVYWTGKVVRFFINVVSASPLYENLCITNKENGTIGQADCHLVAFFFFFFLIPCFWGGELRLVRWGYCGLWKRPWRGSKVIAFPAFTPQPHIENVELDGWDCACFIRIIACKFHTPKFIKLGICTFDSWNFWIEKFSYHWLVKRFLGQVKCNSKRPICLEESPGC